MKKRTVYRPVQSPSRNNADSPASSGTAASDTAARIAVVIPAYNEAAVIHHLAVRVLTQTDLVIVVDDGSEDGTAQILSDLPVTLLKNEINMGKGASLKRGIIYGLKRNVTALITLDGDGQHEPEDIPRFLDMARRYPRHIIIGSRIAEKDMFPRARYYANRVANFWVSWVAGYPIEDSQSGYRLYPASLLRQRPVRDIKSRGFEFESEVLIEAARLGYLSVTVPISAIYGNQVRDSHFRPVFDIIIIIRMIAWKLVSRGMCLSNFYRAFIKPPT